MRITIIGAGIAGLAAGTRLKQAGHQVRMFDKGRGPGGRMASRRVETALGGVVFDHGAQYFTVRNARFAQCIVGWQRDGLVAPWLAAGAAAYVGTPSMNAPLRAMAANLDVTWGARVDAIRLVSGGWRVSGTGVHAEISDAVIVAVPAEQAVALVAPVDKRFAGIAEAAVSAPCWSVMLAFDAPVSYDADILEMPSAPIGWAARNSAKPGRSGPEAWLIQATPEWSKEHVEDTAESVIAALHDALANAVGSALPLVVSGTAHRWLYARSTAAGHELLWEGALQIGVCGDWLTGPHVEAAWLSGDRLASAITG